MNREKKIFPEVFLIFSFYLCFTSCKYKTFEAKNSLNTIYIDVENKSFAPQFGPLLERKIKEVVIEAGGFQLASSPNSSDVDLILEVIDFKKSPGIFDDEDPIVAASLENKITVNVICNEKRSGRPVLEKSFTESSPSVGGDVRSKFAYKNAFLDIAENISKKVSYLLISDFRPDYNEQKN